MDMATIDRLRADCNYALENYRILHDDFSLMILERVRMETEAAIEQWLAQGKVDMCGVCGKLGAHPCDQCLLEMVCP